MHKDSIISNAASWYRRLLGATASLFLLAPAIAGADNVAEWKFDQTSALQGGSEVTLDDAASGASTVSELMKSASVSAEPTGLGKGWQSWLQTGFLESDSGNGRNEFGLVTKANGDEGKNAQFRRYFGQSGIKPDRGGTVYIVVSPKTKSGEARQGLFSTGHRVDGYIGVLTRAGAVVLEVGGRVSGNAELAEAKADVQLDVSDWYFIAATWKGGAAPMIYVRRMDAHDPEKSPAAVEATAEKPCSQFEQPRYDPIAIGATWINTGAEKFTIEGAGARIAWVRLDNKPADSAEMDAVFKSLIASPSSAAATAKP